MNARRNSSAKYFERLGGLETRMDTVEDTLRGHGTKLDQVLAAVSSHTKFDPLRILQVIVFIVGLAAAGGTAITYVSSTTNAGRIAVLEFQTKEMWSAGRWTLNSQNVTRALKQDAAQ